MAQLLLNFAFASFSFSTRKDDQRWPHDGLNLLEVAPRWPHDGPKRHNVDPRVPTCLHDAPLMVEDCSKMAPQEDSTSPRLPAMARNSAERSQDGTKMAPTSTPSGSTQPPNCSSSSPGHFVGIQPTPLHGPQDAQSIEPEPPRGSRANHNNS